MRWLVLLLAAPVQAGEFAVVADSWTDSHANGVGAEYSLGEIWKTSFLVARFRDEYEEPSWYGGVGISRSLVSHGRWDVSASVYALYFKHGPEDVTFYPASGESYIQGGGIVTSASSFVIRPRPRTEYFSAAPALTVQYGMIGASLTAIEMPDEEWSAALQLRITL